MADIRETASNWLEAQRAKHRTRTVTYVRGIDQVELSATIGRTQFEVDDGYGVIERIESRDFLVTTVKLILASQTTLPQRGDVIRETEDGTVFVYEVLAPGKEPHWRYSDAYRRTLRIHTKQIDTEIP